MTKKTIAICVTNDLSYDRRMQRICISLAKNGLKVLFIGRIMNNSYSKDEFDFECIRIKCNYIQGPLFYAEYNLKLYKLLTHIMPDIVYSVDDDTLMACGEFTEKYKSTLIFDAHEYFTEVPELSKKYLKKYIWRGIERRYIRLASHILTVSQSIADIYTKYFDMEVSVIRNCPPRIEQKIHDTFSERIVLYQGALNKGRGLEILIQEAKNIGVNVRIIGEGDLSDELRKLVIKNSATDYIKFYGYISPSELNLHTGKCTIGYNILTTNSLSYRYSLSNKFFDYMHAGKPSVSSSFPEYIKILNEYPCGLTCRPELAMETISKLLSDPSAYIKMSETAIFASQIFCWEKEEKKLLSLINQIV